MIVSIIKNACVDLWYMNMLIYRLIKSLVVSYLLPVYVLVRKVKGRGQC